ncbi:MAG: hypothetical protein Q8909_16470, partial [Bacteroidota bacterium]|nr:hypothetical protein [Bacteroidota bacterium]
HGYDSYLEKIIQQEIQLPAFPRSILKQTLWNELNNRIGKQQNDWLETILFNTPYGWPTVEYYFKNLRDVYNFINHISIPLIKLQGDINEAQFFYLQILRLFHSQIYQIIENDVLNNDNWINAKYLTIKTYEYTVGEVIVLQEKDIHDKTGNTSNMFLIQEIISNSTEIDKDKIIEILQILFPYSSQHDSKQELLIKDHRQIFYKANFKKYFDYNISDIEITSNELTVAFNGGIEMLSDKISIWVKEGKYETLDAYFRNKRDYKNKNDFELHFKAIIIYANQFRPEDNTRIIEFNHIILLEIINQNKKFYPETNRYTQFLLDTFQSYSNLYIFNSLFLANVAKGSSGYSRIIGDFPLTKKSILNLNFELLKKHLLRITEIQAYTFWMFHSCDDENGNKNDEAAKLIIDFASQKDLKNFLRFMVTHSSLDKELFDLSELVIQLFHSEDQFMLFLKKNRRKNAYYQEFMKYINKRNENLGGSVEFPFKEINVNRWSSN